MSTGIAHVETLNARIRETRGKRHARRMRAGGHIPAVLYGHGEQNVSLSVPADEIASALRHGSKVVDLRGEVNDSALIRDVQWDTFGTEVLHLDFTRVSAGESVETAVALELRGDAPGTHEGGILQNPVHEVQIECPVSAIPDKISVNVNTLQLGESITAAELPLPETARLLTDPETVVVQCVQPLAEVEEEEVPAEAQEPEVIGRKEEEEGESEST
jgi:large subunit ribosomal protein L25